MTLRAWHWIRVLAGLDDIGWPVVAYAPRDPAADREASERFDQLIQDDLARSYSRLMDEALEQYLPIPVTPFGTLDISLPVEIGEFPAVEPLPQFANIDKLPRVEDLDPEGAFRPPEWLIDEYIDVMRAPMTVRKLVGQQDISREILDPTYGSAPHARTPRGRRRIWRRRYIWRPIANVRVQLAWWLGGDDLRSDAADQFGGDW